MLPEFRNLSGDELVKALEKLGFVRARQRGSHVVLRRAGTGAVVPLHKELAIGTIKGILRQAKVEAGEVLRLL